jgi:hypothetical protein
MRKVVAEIIFALVIGAGVGAIASGDWSYAERKVDDFKDLGT